MICRFCMACRVYDLKGFGVWDLGFRFLGFVAYRV